MKKYLKMSVWVFLMTVFLNQSFASDLIKAYKKGSIAVQNVTKFGLNSDWGSIIYEQKWNEIVISENNDIFLCCTKQNCIYKFNSNGEFIDKFGQKGQGPGDFYHPKDISILDDKYLVIGEYPMNKRISLFDLDGKFLKVFHTQFYPYQMISLKDGNIAYINYSYLKNPGKNPGERAQIIIRNLYSGNFKIIETIQLPITNVLKLKNNKSFAFNETFSGELVIKKNLDGNLILGITDSRLIKVYSTSGSLISTFSLQIKSEKVTKEYVKKYKNIWLKEFLKKKGSDKRSLVTYNFLKNSDFKIFFCNFLPLYKEILIDGDGDFLVFKYCRPYQEYSGKFQVYSPRGHYICESSIKLGENKFILEKNSKNIQFTKKHLFLVGEKISEEQSVFKIIKVKLNGEG